MRKLSLLLALALAACGGSSDSKKEPKVALFVDTAYVDYEVDDNGAEASNMEAVLAAMSGVTTATCTSSDIESVVAGKNVFVLPEQEEGNVASDIDAGGLALIYDFVHNKGGEFILAYPSNSALALINDAFDYSLASVDSEEPMARVALTGTISITATATGTVFDGGAATLPDLSATTVVDATTLPAGAKVIYADENGDAAVVVIPNGSGNIILLGWDWYDAAPVGEEDGGWNAVFEAAVRY